MTIDRGIQGKYESQQEARKERIAICEVEKVPKEEIDRILAAYPELYGHSAEFIEEVGQ